MDRMLKTVAIPVLTLAVGSIAGFSLGQRQGLGMGLRFVETEMATSLGTEIDAASSVRVGDTDRALALLDARIDAKVLALHDRPGGTQFTTQMADARLYRSVVPPKGPTAQQVRAVLESVPEPAQDDRHAAGLSKLLTQAER